MHRKFQQNNYPAAEADAVVGSMSRALDALLELCADVIVSAAARRSISVGGGGGPPVKKNRRRLRRGAAWAAKNIFSKIHEKISFYPQNFFLRNFFSHQ